MNYMVHEFLSYLFIVCMIIYAWWGWTLFEANVRSRWIPIAWLVMMAFIIVVFLMFMAV